MKSLVDGFQPSISTRPEPACYDASRFIPESGSMGNLVHYMHSRLRHLKRSYESTTL